MKTSAQTEWTFVALTGSGSIIYIDYNFTKVRGGITQVWQKTILEDGTYTIGLSEWNCSKKSFRMGRSALYGENGLIERDDKVTPWRVFLPDSTGMLLYANICQNGQLQPEKSDEQNNAKSNSSFAQIIKKSNLMTEANPRSEIIRKVTVGEKLVLVSEESTGVWYRVLDLKTNSEGWLNGNHFKIVKARKTAKSSRRDKESN